MLKNLFLLGLLMPFAIKGTAQSCTPQGDQITYGTNDTWIGYVYDNVDLTNYKGYVLQGAPGNPDFDQNFGGFYVNYPTNGCSVYTESFSVRYKLRKNFVSGDYDFTVSGDDGYRLSIDGGATWLIDNWNFYGYAANTATVALNGTYDIVLEYYEYAHNNRIGISFAPACTAVDDLSLYGSNNIWRGYVYNGMNFDYYKGLKNEGTSSSPNFDQNFGGNYARFNTNTCQLLAEHFTIRYKLTKTFISSAYSIIVGSEDGYRLSIDGGATWAINNWGNIGYTTSTINANLSGSYDLVLEYMENTGANRISFTVGVMMTLPVEFISFSGKRMPNATVLQWEVGNPETGVHFDVERGNGAGYQSIGTVNGKQDIAKYSFTDQSLVTGHTSYRIKMTDVAGRVKYSQTISIQGEKTTKIYPTFINNGVVYVANEHILPSASLLLTDITGRNVHSQQLGTLAAGQVSSIYLPSGKNLKGVYFLHLLEGNQKIKTESIIIQ